MYLCNLVLLIIIYYSLLENACKYSTFTLKNFSQKIIFCGAFQVGAEYWGGIRNSPGIFVKYYFFVPERILHLLGNSKEISKWCSLYSAWAPHCDSTGNISGLFPLFKYFLSHFILIDAFVADTVFMSYQECEGLPLFHLSHFGLYYWYHFLAFLHFFLSPLILLFAKLYHNILPEILWIKKIAILSVILL